MSRPYEKISSLLSMVQFYLLHPPSCSLIPLSHIILVYPNVYHALMYCPIFNDVFAEMWENSLHSVG